MQMQTPALGCAFPRGLSRRAARLAVTLAAVAALAAFDVQAVVAINAPWIGMTTSTRSARVYMEVQSSEASALVAVRTDAAKRTALRSSDPRAVPLAALPLPAGVAVMLAPGKSSIELIELSGALKLGQRIPLLLVLRDSASGKEREIPINAEVRRRSAIDDELRHHKH